MKKNTIFQAVNAIGAAANLANYYFAHTEPMAYVLRGTSCICNFICAGMAHKAQKKQLETFSLISAFLETYTIGAQIPGGANIWCIASQFTNAFVGLDSDDRSSNSDNMPNNSGALNPT